MTTSLEKAHATFADTGSHAQLPSAPVVFTTQAEVREQLVNITRATERHLAIWSGSLDSDLLDSPAFLEAMKRFVLARRHARVRILTRRLPSGEHALLAMAERLPASFEVRMLASPGLDAAELMLSDDRGVLYRIHNDRWDGMADVNDPLVARFYMAQFNACWRLAQPADRSTGM